MLTPNELADAALKALGYTAPPVNPALQAARTDFEHFCQAVWRDYKAAPHIRIMNVMLGQVARYIETEGREGIGRLAIFLAPRHGKSRAAAVSLPAYVLGRKPDTKIILTSYGASLAEEHSRQVRSLVRSGRYKLLFPSSRLAPDSQARADWHLADPFSGGFRAVGREGLTGRGAGLIIFDDMLSGRQEAESEASVRSVWSFIKDDCLTRLEFPGAIINISTRWSTADPAQKLIEAMPETWTVLRLPALSEGEGDPLERPEGEALWPEMFDKKWLESQRLMMGDYSFSAEYQQSPVLLSGGLFDRDVLRASLVLYPPYIKKAVRFFDLAMSSKSSADATASVLLGEGDDGNYYVLDVTAARVDWGDLADYLAGIVLQDDPDTVIALEKKGYMSRAVQELNRDKRLADRAIFGVDVEGDKFTRVLPCAAKLAAGVLRVLHRPWTEAFFAELVSFGGSAHDDRVDALSGAYNYLAERAKRKPVTARTVRYI